MSHFCSICLEVFLCSGKFFFTFLFMTEPPLLSQFKKRVNFFSVLFLFFCCEGYENEKMDLATCSPYKLFFCSMWSYSTESSFLLLPSFDLPQEKKYGLQNLWTGPSQTKKGKGMITWNPIQTEQIKISLFLIFSSLIVIRLQQECTKGAASTDKSSELCSTLYLRNWEFEDGSFSFFTFVCVRRVLIFWDGKASNKCCLSLIFTFPWFFIHPTIFLLTFWSTKIPTYLLRPISSIFSVVFPVTLVGLIYVVKVRNHIFA